MSALPTLGGINGSANGVASHGLIAGALDTTTKDPSCTPPQAFDFVGVYWDSLNQLYRLSVPVGDTVAFASGINSAAHAIGFSGPCGLSPTSFAHPVVWIPNSPPILLATLGAPLPQDGTADGISRQIGDAGHIATIVDIKWEVVRTSSQTHLLPRNGLRGSYVAALGHRLLA
jgi:hypothetical protein